MILEFKRISPEWMYKISEEGFSSRNKNLDHIIIFGKRETSREQKYSKKELYDFVERRIYYHRDILVPQIKNEIEYYEKHLVFEKEQDEHSLAELDSQKNIEDEILQRKDLVIGGNNYSRFNLKEEVEKFANRMIETKKLDIDDTLFPSKAKKKFLAELSKRPEVELLNVSRVSIRTYFSKFKSEYIKEKRREKRKKKQKKL